MRPRPPPPREPLSPLSALVPLFLPPLPPPTLISKRKLNSTSTHIACLSEVGVREFAELRVDVVEEGEEGENGADVEEEGEEPGG